MIMDGSSSEEDVPEPEGRITRSKTKELASEARVTRSKAKELAKEVRALISTEMDDHQTTTIYNIFTHIPQEGPGDLFE